MATKEQVYATVAAELIKDGILEPDKARALAARFTGGNPYKTRANQISDETVSRVVEALEKLDPNPKNFLANLAMVGLQGVAHGKGKESLAEALDMIGKESVGPSVASLVQQQLAGTKEMVTTLVANAQKEIAETKAQAMAAAEARASKGNGGPRAQMIAQGENAKGCTPDDPEIGQLTPGKTPPAKPTGKSQGPGCNR